MQEADAAVAPSRLTLVTHERLPSVGPPSGVVLRSIDEGDLEPLGRLYYEAYDPGIAAATRDDALADIRATFGGAYGELRRDASFVAVEDRRLVGAILVVDRPPWPDLPEASFVVELLVDRSARRQGLGRALLGRASAAVSGSLALRVAGDNHAALELYRSVGFRETNTPRSRGARIDILLTGSLNRGVRSTCTLVRDGDLVAVIDPGLAPGAGAILDPLRGLGIQPDDVTAVILSHHHPDHTVNAALFPKAEIHDHWAVYRDDTWISRECEGAELSRSVRLLRTPGHSAEDVSTLIGTADGVVVATHLWWTADGPADDPYAPDRDQLRRSRERVLALADRIIPGHGPAFVPDEATPR